MRVAEQLRAGSASRVRTTSLGWARNPWVWLTVVIGGLILLLSVAGLTNRLDPDEGAFLAIAQEILHGRVPYRDAFDQKSPAIYYLVASVLALGGGLGPLQQVLAMRGVALLADFMAAVGLFLLGRRWWRTEVGILAALLWLVGLALYGGDQFFTEPFATSLTIWAVVTAASRPGIRGALLAGFLLALGTLFKQTAVLALPGVALVLCTRNQGDGRWGWAPPRYALAAVGAALVGFVAPWLAVGAAFAAAGAFGPMLDQVIVSNLTRYPADPLRVLLTLIAVGLNRYLLVWVVAAVVAFVGLGRSLLPRGASGSVPSVGALVAGGLAVLNIVPFKSHAYPHYWLQVLPWAALLAAMGLLAGLELLRPAPEGSPADAGYGVTAARVLPLVLVGMVILSSGRVYPTLQIRTNGAGLQAQVNGGRWIAASTPPGARMLVVPDEPEYYYLSGRMAVTSFVYLLPINISDSLVAQVTDDVLAIRFDAIVWAGGPPDRSLAPVYRALLLRYHPASNDPELGLQMYLPNTASFVPAAAYAPPQPARRRPDAPSDAAFCPPGFAPPPRVSRLNYV
jgi:4-amino-4-deoxy-L-arabinose transferase-like glycosyltransferase